MPVLPFYGADRPQLFEVERRSMDRPGLVIERLRTTLPTRGTILDVGAGDGWTARLIAREGRPVLALEPAVELARRSVPHPDVSWVAGEAGALPFVDASVDAAIASWAYFFPSHLDPTRGLHELHRVVRPGGTIAIVANAGDDEFTGLGVQSQGEPLDWFTAHGFEIDLVETVFDLGGEDPVLARQLLALYVGGEDRLPAAVPQRLGYRVAVCHLASRGPAPVRVRSMRLGEAERVGRITLAAYDAYGEMSGWYRTFLGDPRQRLAGSTAVLVAEREGEVMGTVTYVRPDDEQWEGREELEGDCAFRVLAVDPEAEGQGVAQALVRACTERAREEGRHRMVITSMAWMDRAHLLYTRLGFDPRPDLAVRFPNGDGVAFSLDLTDEAADRFPPPGPVPAEPPWYEDVWVT